MNYWDFMGVGSVRLKVNEEWVDYKGTTSLRKLYYRAVEAQRSGKKSFFVHDFPRRSVSGIRLKPGFHVHLSCVSMDGVPVEEMPCEIDLQPAPPKIRVFDGSLVNPYKLTSTDMKPYVFIHSISTLSRFHGHANYPYTVGQHSRNLCLLVPDHLKRAALIHDFSEALFNDLASPVKRENPEYRVAENACGQEIASFFGVGVTELLNLDQYDKRIYVNERDVLFAGKVGERGMGDQNVPLPTNGMDLFGETHWRKVRADLTLLWLTYFPEFDLYTGDTINAEHRGDHRTR